MNVWGLNDAHDMYRNGDEIARLSGIEQLRQSIKTRLLFFFNEWFLDSRAGVRWYQEIFVKPANIVIAEALIKKEILETEGVIALLSFDVEFDTSNRHMKVLSFSAKTTYGIIEESL